MAPSAKTPSSTPTPGCPTATLLFTHSSRFYTELSLPISKFSAHEKITNTRIFHTRYVLPSYKYKSKAPQILP
eukprot:13161852-Ditylum_brightwellii.AAC.1